MVFSFFKKKDTPQPEAPEIKTPKVALPSGQVRAPSQAPATSPKVAEPPTKSGAPTARGEPTAFEFSTMGEFSIEVSESTDTLSPAMEQAAILYANEQNDAAVATLIADIETVEGHHALDTWLMLFELYQLENRKTEFDELALQFVVEFERSAPVWHRTTPTAATPQAGAKPTGASFIFPASLTTENIDSQLDLLDKASSAQPGAARIDFGRITQIDPVAAAAMVVRWGQFRKKGRKFQPSGGTQFAQLLKSKIEVMRRELDEEPYWLLLLDVYQLIGLFEEFENLAVDYAVTYEVSPPSWDAAAKQKTAAEVAAEEAKLAADIQASDDANKADDDVFRFQGAILSANDATFAALNQYAESVTTVQIDLTKVPRVDFVSAGVLVNVLMGMVSAGKSIVIGGANELIVALFRIMGIADFAKVVRKK
ncbi:STAS domain-containing protein [Parachitinimonas caeni]|uniref:STAS domain-containing protein n=1 Tax=Parachitinimonas caeni TaxID=3031301 RepID=A0ABT7DY72_9NEIS|nr:STAS domain-containing protein [Parachitinimonas caeni]MDK2125008.1 STAS domain-containing protein [Parachitinimonas caeni]